MRRESSTPNSRLRKSTRRVIGTRGARLFFVRGAAHLGWGTALAAASVALVACGGDASSATATASDGGASLDDASGATDAGGASDVASGDAAKTDCSRRAQVKNAPPSLYDAFVADMASVADATARASRVDQLLADVRAQGGTPLEAPGDDRVVFLVRGAPPNGAWNVAGSFRPGMPDWKASPLAMTQIAGTDLWVADTRVPRGMAAQYKLLGGTTDDGFREDLLAMNVVWDGIDHQDVGQFNGLVHASDADATKGRLVAYRGVHAQKLGDTRDVFVYLPARYDDGSCAPLPHLLVHDGNESLTRGDFAGVADQTFAQDPSSSSILGFVALSDQNVRMDEYTFHTSTALGDAYGDFLANEIEPMLASRYRLCSAPEDRGLSGASLGGLISTYLAFQKPSTWGYVGAQSASLFWDSNAMITRGGQDPKVPVRFYLDHGCPDDNCDENRAMATALTQKGYELDHVEVANAEHAWSYWHDRFPQALRYFRQGRPACK